MRSEIAATCAPPDPQTWSPRVALPAGACDCHAHVFGPRTAFPYAAERHYTPPESTLADYLHMLDRIGCAHGVLVQPGVYGFDNACLLDALRRSGGRLRGVVDLDLAATPDDPLAGLRAQGVRGLRLDLRREQDLAAVAARVAPFGWHLDCLVGEPAQVTAHAGPLARIGVPLVVEGLGMLSGGLSPVDGGFLALVEMARAGSIWVKLSHAYKVVPSGPPYAAMTPLARALAEAAPNRLLWGTDWPHPNVAGPMPNDGMLADLAAEWVPDAAARRRMLVANPAALYGFPVPDPSGHNEQEETLP